MQSLFDQNSFETITSSMTPEIIESLNNCQVSRAPLKTIEVMRWPRGLKVLTCMSAAIFKTGVELEKLAEK